MKELTLTELLDKETELIVYFRKHMLVLISENKKKKSQNNRTTRTVKTSSGKLRRYRVFFGANRRPDFDVSNPTEKDFRFKTVNSSSRLFSSKELTEELIRILTYHSTEVYYVSIKHITARAN